MNNTGRKHILAIKQLAADGLWIDHFTAASGEAWCLIGNNGSGIEQFCAIITGDTIDYRAQKLRLPPDIGVLSFTRQQSLFEAELRKDDTDFLDRPDPGTPTRVFLTDIDRHRFLLDLFAFSGLLDRGYRQLSSGQARKLCLLQQITGGIGYLVLENPYEGLDQTSCTELDRVLAGLRDQGFGLLILINNSADIPDWCTHLAVFRAGTIAVQGPRADVLVDASDWSVGQLPLFRVTVEDFRQDRRQPESTDTTELVALRAGFARYGTVDVFNGLDLVINRGDHTLITGPNGSGKSTLLQLISGDHPLCYANDLTLFGRRRGSGESIWELKRRMGILSPDLHRNHRVAGSGLAAVVSGLFDSIGLYTSPSEAQLQLGRRWLARLGLTHKAQQPFRQMHYGEQRLLLLARALIKAPELLLLDEPTQGLDESNRMALLDFLASIAGEQLATIVYVSHRPDEYRDFFRKHIRFA
jgi:ABC-type molybdenum transport system, ATPase component/photorepair protein PhrA